jgi:hypothetical protein
MNERHRWTRVGSRLMLAAGLMLVLSAAPAASAQQETLGSRAAGVAGDTFDLLVLRSMGLVATAAGAGFFLVSAPFVAPFGNVSDAWDVFLYGPLDYTFRRPLGDF